MAIMVNVLSVLMIGPIDVSTAATAPSSYAVSKSADELLRRAATWLADIGHDPTCYDAQLVDRLTDKSESPTTTRPVHTLEVVYRPHAGVADYPLQSNGTVRTGSMRWRLEREPPTQEQQHAIDVAYSLYREAYPQAPPLAELLISATEARDMVIFEFVAKSTIDRARSEEAQKDVIVLVHGPQIKASKTQLALNERPKCQ